MDNNKINDIVFFMMWYFINSTLFWVFSFEEFEGGGEAVADADGVIFVVLKAQQAAKIERVTLFEIAAYLCTQYHGTVVVVFPTLIAAEVHFVLPVVGIQGEAYTVDDGIVLHGLVGMDGLPAEEAHPAGNSDRAKMLGFLKLESFADGGIEEIAGVSK